MAAAQETEGASAGGLQDIVVTAQRRSEKLQDVPISVSALTAESMAATGVAGTGDLSIAVPGLELGRQNIAISPFIRGIGNKSTAPGEEAAVALYIDGVYIPTLTGGLFSLDNIERVEVLKGPQGTLFGRNAAAGVIQIITRDPKDTPAADFKMSYANYDTLEGSLYATTGIAKGVRADIAAFVTRQGDGWGKNVFTGNDVYKGYERSLRSKWVFDLGENTELKAAVDYTKAKPNTPPAYRPLEGRQLIDGTPFQGFYNVAETRDVYATTRQWGANVQLRHSFDALDFVSITSYRDVVTDWIFDQDGTPTNFVKPTTHEIGKSWTQELQLLSPKGSPLTWILGGYFYDNISKYDPLTLEGNLFGPNVIDRYSTIKARSFAGFGQITVPLGDATNVTGGLRYTHDKRTIDAFNITNKTVTTLIPSQAATFNKLTWRASIDHRFSDQVLIYAAASRGFKSGVFNAVSPTDAAVRPETVDTYEGGFKTDLLDRHLRLNGAVFYNRFKDIQFQVNIPGGTRLINAAAARTYGFELDVEARPVDNVTVRAGLTFLNGKNTDFQNAPFYTRTPTGLGGNTAAIGDATGFDTIHTPPLTLTVSGDYTIPSDIGDFTLNGSFYHNDGYYFDAQNALPQKAYNLVNASLRYEAKDGRWGARLWGKNLNNAQYYTAIVPQRWGDTATPAAPRTFGMTIDLHLK